MYQQSTPPPPPFVRQAGEAQLVDKAGMGTLWHIFEVFFVLDPKIHIPTFEN